ncbi:cell division protein FtsL [Streptococcus sp. sy004]|uniref:cell division protein FtsL n=1 Tax=Streptococcus sp. sy004 TaxID=2600149 RepID=UPI0011B6C1E8|nr:cell division protein FtsL [Streptococcus sp. sy004]TWT11266.1 cell division protein FtsL [Streptococcus sp. sy004]
MTREKRQEALSQAVQAHIRTLSRIEKAFYASIVLTAVMMAVSIVYLQSRMLQLQQEVTILNNQISEKETELNDAKQEVNELNRFDRISKIATEAGLSIQHDNIGKVE